MDAVSAEGRVRHEGENKPKAAPAPPRETGRAPEDAEKTGLSVIGRLKAFAHGNQQAYAVNADECHACGLCVKACPESAIRLVPA
jgi:NAD-dependent dihydropyrimidine dehydrogenase PreA subunit